MKHIFRLYDTFVLRIDNLSRRLPDTNDKGWYILPGRGWADNIDNEGASHFIFYLFWRIIYVFHMHQYWLRCVWLMYLHVTHRFHTAMGDLVTPISRRVPPRYLWRCEFIAVTKYMAPYKQLFYICGTKRATLAMLQYFYWLCFTQSNSDYSHLSKSHASWKPRRVLGDICLAKNKSSYTNTKAMQCDAVCLVSYIPLPKQCTPNKIPLIFLHCLHYLAN